jgi:LuxR family maltose regulon positive regulatory protein
VTAPLLTTKLHIPPIQARERVVPRPHLLERLDAGLGLNRKLTLISAPAGFGKTTLVSEWVQAMGDGTPPVAVAWLSLDEGDNDLAQFLAYVVGALQTVDGHVGQGLLAALQSPGEVNVEAVLTILINEITTLRGHPSNGSRPGLVLVLDDYHVIESHDVDQALIFALDHLPPEMHLVIASRIDPSLPLSRLRAGGKMTEIREDDLRFSLDEADMFLDKVMGLDLTVEEVTALETRTEGWIAGLQLAALSMQGLRRSDEIADFVNRFTGSDRYIQDYLTDEVLRQRPKGTKDFLLHTAILNRLSGPLCDAVRFGVVEPPSTPAVAGVRSDGAASSSSSTGTAVSEQRNSQAILEALDAANLFIVPLDNERRWYRYHQLFSDLLRQRLLQNPPPLVQGATVPKGEPVLSSLQGTKRGVVAELHSRASVWYEQNGFPDEAIEHALRGEDLERAAQMIETHADNIWQFGVLAKLRRWLDEIPAEVIYSRPHLCILDAGNLLITGQADEAERRLQAVQQALGRGAFYESDTEPGETDQPLVSINTKLLGRAAVIQSHLLSYQGDATGAIQRARRALELLPQSDTIWRWSAFDSLGTVYCAIDEESAYQVRLDALEACKATGNAYMIVFASLRLVVTLRDLGRLEQAMEICQQQLKLANENGLSQTALVGWLYTLWGEILAERGELGSALQMANKGVALAARGKDVTLRGSSYLCLIRVLYSKGELDTVKEIIQELKNPTLKQGLSPWIEVQLAAWRARIDLAQNKLAPARRWAEEIELDINGELTPIHDFDYVVLARVYIAQGRLGEAARLLQRLFEAAEAGERISKLIEILMLQALTSQAKGNTIQALNLLERALTLAEPGGFVRIFVDEEGPMAELLCAAASRGMMPHYVAALLAAFDVHGQPGPGQGEVKTHLPPAARAQPLVEPLSQRELQVLQLIAQGLSNREIGERLFLALSTVKGHNRNIYGKLQVQRRTEAVARARELDLL